jgi:hypothetical protein
MVGGIGSFLALAPATQPSATPVLSSGLFLTALVLLLAALASPSLQTRLQQELRRRQGVFAASARAESSGAIPTVHDLSALQAELGLTDDEVHEDVRQA